MCYFTSAGTGGHINIATFFWSFKSKEFECPSFHRLYEKTRCWYADVVCFRRVFLGRALEYHCYHTNWFALCPTHGTTAWWILRWHTTYGGGEVDDMMRFPCFLVVVAKIVVVIVVPLCKCPVPNWRRGETQFTDHFFVVVSPHGSGCWVPLIAVVVAGVVHNSLL